LGNLGTDVFGNSYANHASGINDAGIAVGQSARYVAGVDRGPRAVRWEASGAASELPSLGDDGSGATNSGANAINNNGVIVGSALKYVAGSSKGTRGVRWTSTGPQELANLGTAADGTTSAEANA